MSSEEERSEDSQARELAKTYDPALTENAWYSTWLTKGVFAASSDSAKPAYSVLMPPPNVTGMLHMGHVLNHTIQDVYIRWRRMAGDESCWFPGADHAGIATQARVEKLLAQENLTRYDLGREKFLERVWQWREQYGDIILDQLRKIGVSCDWERMLFTLDESASKAVSEVFIRLFDEGLIYRGKRIINWSPLAQTALSDEEVESRETQDVLYTLRYYPEDAAEPLLVATVRPETIFGDVAVAVNPDDERYRDLIGTKVRVPLADKLVPVIADEYADPTFGTGAVKITPAHDPNDFEVGQRHDLPMPNSINPDATLNELAGEFQGLDRFDARKRIVERLRERDLIEKEEEYMHSVGYSQRGGEAVEPFLSDQWFVNMKALAAPALEVVQSGEVRFFPQHWTKTYEHWMSNIRDWCISRQLWWGHRIPVYYAPDGSFTAARSAEEACAKLGLPEDTPLRQDPDVLDTWFSSALWPLTTMRWLADGQKEQTADLAKFLPTNLLVTGPDIIFFWVARMIMMTKKFKGVIPFRDVYFTSMIRDARGRKMSKSLGNSPDPLDIIAKYGADAMRFTIIYVAPIGQDIRLKVDEKTQDIATMEIGRNFANKIWNAARFLLMKHKEVIKGVAREAHEDLPTYRYDLTDSWITSRFHETIRDTQRALQEYRLHEYAGKLYEFIWNDFCDWYVEMLKIRVAHSPTETYRQEMVNHAFLIFEGILRLLHPVMPFITEELWHAITDVDSSDSIVRAPVPTLDEARILPQETAQFRTVQSIVEELRAMRGQMNIPPHERLPITLACPDDPTSELLKSERHIITELARGSNLHIGRGLAKPAGAIATVVNGVDVFLTLKGFIDLDKEKQRLAKEIGRLKGMIKGTAAKLQNEKFLANAPASVVEHERGKLANLENTLAKLSTNLEQLAE